MNYTHEIAREETILAPEAAKRLRRELSREFSRHKFRVRTNRSLSLHIDWIDGPTAKQVDAIASHYAGEGFDGLIDMSYPLYHYLTPTGDLRACGTPGTTGSVGCIQPVAPHIPAECKPCYLMTRYVITQRHYSPHCVDQTFHSARQLYRDLSNANLKYVISPDGYANWWIENAPRGNEILSRILDGKNFTK